MANGKRGRPSEKDAWREKVEAYLEERQTEYEAQPTSKRTATLPHLAAEGKVNVSALATALGMSTTQRKYLYEDQFMEIVNVVCEAQGLYGIGARVSDPGDEAIKQRLITQAKSAKADAQAATEAKAREEALMEELRQVQDENALLAEENMRLKSQLDMIYAGNIARVT